MSSVSNRLLTFPGMVIGFSVNATRAIQSHAASLSVPIVLESVIYRLIDTVRSKVAELLPPVIETRVTGEAVVQQIFSIKVGRGSVSVAGCRVSNGVIGKHDGVRVLRGADRAVVFEGKNVNGDDADRIRRQARHPQARQDGRDRSPQRHTVWSFSPRLSRHPRGRRDCDLYVVRNAERAVDLRWR